MVMLMIKFGAYKAACCWVCAPSFSRRQQLMTRRREKGFGRARKESEKSGFRTKTALLPSLLLFFFPQFFPSLSPSPRRRRLFLLCIVLRGGRGRERDAGTTENASVTDDSEQSSDDE